MKILVFVKQVPNTDDVQLDPATGNLRREGVQSILNPLDANAVETAMELKARYGGTVCVISMGPPQAGAVLQRALAMGCDEAYLLSDRAFGGADTLATSYTLAKAAEKIGITGSPSATKEVFVPQQREAEVYFFSGEMEEIVQSFADMLHEERII